MHIARAAGGNGKGCGTVAGIQTGHILLHTVDADTGLDVTAVAAIEGRNNQLQSGVVGDFCVGDASLIVYLDASHGSVQECLAGQVVGQILQSNRPVSQTVEVADTDTGLTDNDFLGRIFAIVSNVHIHTACCIAQVEACAVAYLRVTVATKSSIILTVMVNEAPVSQVALDTLFIEAVAGDGDLCASVNEAANYIFL